MDGCGSKPLMPFWMTKPCYGSHSKTFWVFVFTVHHITRVLTHSHLDLFPIHWFRFITLNTTWQLIKEFLFLTWVAWTNFVTDLSGHRWSWSNNGVQNHWVPLSHFGICEEERLKKSGPELFRELKRIYSVGQALMKVLGCLGLGWWGGWCIAFYCDVKEGRAIFFYWGMETEFGVVWRGSMYCT